MNKIAIRLFLTIIILFLLLYTKISYPQPEHPEVKSANDVIENYLTSIGGKNKLKRIHSYRISGSANFFGTIVPYDEYADSNKFYMNIGSDTIKIIKLVINDKTRWVESYKDGEDTLSIIDISDEHHANWNIYLLKYNFFFFFVNYMKYDLTLKFDSSDLQDKESSYEIAFSKDDTVRCRAVFNKNNFHLTKFTVETPAELVLGFNNLSYHFEDYREINNKGLILPFTIIRNEVVPIEISDYIFNTTIDEKLIQKNNPNR